MESNMKNNQRKGKGRQKIEIKKIPIKSRRNVTFSKRKDGIFSMATRLSQQFNAKIAVVIFSAAGKPYILGDVDYLLMSMPSTSASAAVSPSIDMGFPASSFTTVGEHSSSTKSMGVDDWSTDGGDGNFRQDRTIETCHCSDLMMQDRFSDCHWAQETDCEQEGCDVGQTSEIPSCSESSVRGVLDVELMAETRDMVMKANDADGQTGFSWIDDMLGHDDGLSGSLRNAYIHQACPFRF